VGYFGLKKVAFIVGAFNDATFEQETLQLDSGDTLVMFSDGISEALNTVGDEFGDERLLACVRANQGLAPQILLECLLETVHQFTAGAAQSDDLTLLVLRYLGPRRPNTYQPSPRQERRSSPSGRRVQKTRDRKK
jgi:phosphoserine phosphatase RsbU/P